MGGGIVFSFACLLVFVQISMHTTASTQWNFYRTSSFDLLLMDVYIRYPYVLFVICVLN